MGIDEEMIEMGNIPKFQIQNLSRIPLIIQSSPAKALTVNWFPHVAKTCWDRRYAIVLRSC